MPVLRWVAELRGAAPTAQVRFRPPLLGQVEALAL